MEFWINRIFLYSFNSTRCWEAGRVKRMFRCFCIVYNIVYMIYCNIKESTACIPPACSYFVAEEWSGFWLVESQSIFHFTPLQPIPSHPMAILCKHVIFWNIIKWIIFMDFPLPPVPPVTFQFHMDDARNIAYEWIR